MRLLVLCVILFITSPKVAFSQSDSSLRCYFDNEHKIVYDDGTSSTFYRFCWEGWFKFPDTIIIHRYDTEAISHRTPYCCFVKTGRKRYNAGCTHNEGGIEDPYKFSRDLIINFKRDRVVLIIGSLKRAYTLHKKDEGRVFLVACSKLKKGW